MHQPFIQQQQHPQQQQPRDDRSAYEYSIQATEDYHEEARDAPGDAGTQQPAPVWRQRTTPDYKPRALRWPFISVMIGLLLIAIALIVVAEKKMPDSDTSAIILGTSPDVDPAAQHKTTLRPRRFPRAAFSNSSTSTQVSYEQTSSVVAPISEDTSTSAKISSEHTSSGVAPISEDTTTSAKISSEQTSSGVAPISEDSSRKIPQDVSTTQSLPEVTSISSAPVPPTQSSSLDVTRTSQPTRASTSSGPPLTESTDAAKHPATSSGSLSGDATVVTGLDVGTSLSASVSRSGSGSGGTSSTASLPSGATLIPVITTVSKFTTNITIPVTTVNYTRFTTTTRTSSFTSKSAFTTTFVSTVTSVAPTSFQSYWSTGGSSGTSFSTGVATQIVPTTVEAPVSTTVAGVSTITEVESTVIQSTLTGVVIPSVGEITITSFRTVFPEKQPVTQSPDPVVVTATQVDNGETIAIVHTQGPPVVIEVPTQEVRTQVINEKVTTGVIQVGGSAVTNVVVVTPSAGVSVDLVTTVGGTPVTVVNTPDPVTALTVINGVERTVVQTQAPQTVISVEGGTATTIAAVLAPSQIGQPVTYTVVNTVGGSRVTQVFSATLAEPPYEPITYTAVREAGGTLVTDLVVATPTGSPGQAFTYTAVQVVGGTPVTQVVVTTPVGTPFQPITYTVVREAGGTLVTDLVVTTPTGSPGQAYTYTAVQVVGGTPVTQVVVTTPAGAPFQPVTYTVVTNIGGTPTVITTQPDPTTFVTTINGVPVTTVTTPPITSFTTTMGGTLTTQTLVTTPTNTGLITLTLVSTTGGTLSTFTSTLSAGSTFLTTISGSLRTVTSTPSLSTSFLTRPATTRTLKSTVAPTSAPTSTSSPPPRVIASTKVYKWTYADIFVGTFLPALLGIALVIPLRIIDLNAKLYQPFQSLARPGGGSGEQTLLMQYSGLMAFVTPVVTMLRGHPVPFITTVMVGLASFMVPLATEAVGLKLHGECYTNTANQNKCGPALGVSPTPAHVLVGLMAAVIILLLAVGWFEGKWKSGVSANPWCLAGVASLGLSEGVRIRQESEKGMRRGLREKVFGFGYFAPGGNENQNQTQDQDQNHQAGGVGVGSGAESYGIVLLDESGRGLQQGDGAARGSGSDDAESEVFDANTAAAKAGSSGNHLPLMVLRYPWRIALIFFELAVLVFIIYYHAYYRGGIKDGGKLWSVMTGSLFGVRFVSAVIGVVIAFCWQSFFLSVSTMTPFQIMAKKTQSAKRSILFSPSTNPFSGLYSAIKTRHLFLMCVSAAAILSEFLPVLLSNVPFSLHQTSTAATVCAVLSSLFLALQLAVLIGSFFVRYPPMPVDPRSIAGMLYYVSESYYLLGDMEGVSLLDGEQRALRVMEAGRRYYYGVLAGGTWRRLGVDCDLLADGDGHRRVWGGHILMVPLPLFFPFSFFPSINKKA
ncbi:Zonadhesin [Cladorrhinum samala]|uniref:Zonadhesin n=1 Tax=Cladorrhinum samala TaxID=585594 RepID=A0AAV9HQ16_9PEZI|nr:Zonadhesin [Cladorrhinum samala]